MNKKIKIGDYSPEYGVFLAPMAGFSDRAMRRVCRDMGVEYAVTEMISAKAVTFGDKKTYSLAKIKADEGEVGLQIFGSEPDVMARAADILSRHDWGEGYVRPNAIDINMGCPVAKIFNNGEGSALMRSPELIERITRSVKENTDLPVTVKIRAGVDPMHVNAVECALAAEMGGASLITVHGRTKVQMYSGTVDRDIIKKVKESVHIPVIANGDIVTADDAISMLSYTGADGIAIGRGAVGNPFLFRDIIFAMRGDKPVAPTLKEKVDVALLQLRLAIEDKGERTAVPEARKQIALYLRSFRGAANIRAEINRALTYSEVESILLDALNKENNDD
jgi:tRNA-dihydrouridine synthase B